MTKQIQGITPHGQKLIIVAPNLSVYSFSKTKKVTFLEIFYFFAQDLIKTRKKKLSKKEEKEIIIAKTRILIELDNRVNHLLYFAKKVQDQGKKILKARTKKKSKKIYDYKPYQIFQAHLIAYLNSLHSIRDEVQTIDALIGKKYSNNIWNKRWFKIDIDLRNLFHHIETPIISVSGNKFNFIINRTSKLIYPQYFKDKSLNRVIMSLDINDPGADIIKELNLWAKKYLNLIDKKRERELIVGFEKDGRFISKKVTLGELMKKAQTIA